VAAVIEPLPLAAAADVADVDEDRVILGDSLAVARATPAGRLDAIYVDPPFGTGKVQRARGGAYADDGDDPAAHVAWLAPWLEASRKALAPTGSLFVHLDWRAVHHVKVFLDGLFGRACFAGGLEPRDAPRQLALDEAERARGERLGDTLDRLRDKFGDAAVQRAIELSDGDPAHPSPRRKK
jgi:hypothetical protein